MDGKRTTIRQQRHARKERRALLHARAIDVLQSLSPADALTLDDVVAYLRAHDIRNGCGKAFSAGKVWRFVKAHKQACGEQLLPWLYIGMSRVGRRRSPMMERFKQRRIEQRKAKGEAIRKHCSSVACFREGASLLNAAGLSHAEGPWSPQLLERYVRYYRGRHRENLMPRALVFKRGGAVNPAAAGTSGGGAATGETGEVAPPDNPEACTARAS